jgi:hypothetical protein
VERIAMSSPSLRFEFESFKKLQLSSVHQGVRRHIRVEAATRHRFREVKATLIPSVETR